MIVLSGYHNHTVPRQFSFDLLIFSVKTSGEIARPLFSLSASSLIISCASKLWEPFKCYSNIPTRNDLHHQSSNEGHNQRENQRGPGGETGCARSRLQRRAGSSRRRRRLGSRRRGSVCRWRWRCLGIGGRDRGGRRGCRLRLGVL